MIVVDAGLITEHLADGARTDVVDAFLVGHPDLAAPSHILIEVASALRGLERVGKLRSPVEELFATLRALRLHLIDPAVLLERALELRHNAPVYDALCFAAAEYLDVPLATVDSKFRSVPARCTVEVV
jgi:predicted nucleic acid-binding protein